jgi:pimeloyl-ACP methyl ester carboxylesterase
MSNEFIHNGIAYYKEGKGEVVVLLHGYPMDKNIWLDLIPVLSSSHQVIAIDIPGLGNSNALSINAIHTIADQIHDLLQHERVGKAVFVGHSMGGYIALAYSDLYRKMIKGLSLVHSTLKADSEEKKIMRLKVIDLIKNGGTKVFLRELFPSLFAADRRNVFKSEWEALYNHHKTTSPTSLIALYEAIMHRKNYAESTWNEFPMQWIIGEKDQLLDPKDLIAQALQSDKSFVSLYPDCGHMSMIENKAQFENDILEFTNYCYAKTNQK